MKDKRLRTWKYNDATISEEWDLMYDGEWKLDKDCYEVVYKINRNFYKNN